MGQILEQIPADVAGWMAVVAGLAMFALLLRLDQARKDRRSMIVPAPPAGQLEPGSEWRKIMDVSLAEITRSPDLQCMQARAAAQIDAAEHAFNRLLAECARVSTPLVAPTFEPLRQLPREPAAAPEQQQPLAA
jgi:hypothetical protein